ncbi:MAG: hypothetical protein MUF45_05360 [Spirosomaceae bacterium]|jgi:hypothetical protein|nr:hypothetical protein [Spirosomataceae bacterium]
MKTLKEFENKNIPLVAIDKNLDKLQNTVMFTEKLAKANRVLSKVKLPNQKN